MAELSPVNGYGDSSSATQLANRTVEVQVVDPAPVAGSSRRTRARAASSAPILMVNLVIPVRNEARNSQTIDATGWSKRAEITVD